jgi:hypothetical protein
VSVSIRSISLSLFYWIVGFWTWPHLIPLNISGLLGLSYFSGRVLCFCPGPASDHSPTYSLLHTWVHWSVPQCLALLMRWSLTNIFALAGLNSPPDLLLPSTARITGVKWHAYLFIFETPSAVITDVCHHAQLEVAIQHPPTLCL